MKKDQKINRPFLIITITLTFLGIMIFLSTALGLLAKDGARFASITTNQIGIGLFGGGIIAFITSLIPYRFWGVYSFWLYILGLITLILVFIPGIGFSAGGAQRWILIGPMSFQPVEFMKIGYILFLANYFSSFKKEITTLNHGLYAFLIISGIPALLLILQPDIDNTIIMIGTGAAMYFLAGAKIKHLLLLVCIGLVCLGGLIAVKPYAIDRITTFLDPSADPLTSSYQIRQSLIAVGSGQFFGKGFGKSLQKFQYLPEAHGDSIYAVASEEFGFIGSSLLVVLFFLFLIFGLKIASKARDSFGRLTVLGIVIMITSQSFLNMAAMLGLVPLSGLPLLFVSHGGTALFFTLLSVGIVFNISKHQKK